MMQRRTCPGGWGPMEGDPQRLVRWNSGIPWAHICFYITRHSVMFACIADLHYVYRVCVIFLRYKCAVFILLVPYANDGSSITMSMSYVWSGMLWYVIVYITLHCITSHYIIFRYVTSRHAMSCYVMLCYPRLG